MAYQTIFASELGQTVLLFILLFTIIFAILQKSKVLGGGKQIDALVALSMGLLVSGVGYVLDFTQKIIPFMAVVIITVLVFLILGSLFFRDTMDFGKAKWYFAALMGVIVVIAVVVFTGSWTLIREWFSDSDLASNFILIVIVIVVVMFIYFSTDKKKDKD
jgi:hypothetical protein